MSTWSAAPGPTMESRDRRMSRLIAALSRHACMTLKFARAEAVREGSTVVDTRHLLLALIGDPATWPDEPRVTIAKAREASLAYGASAERAPVSVGWGQPVDEDRELVFTDQVIAVLAKAGDLSRLSAARPALATPEHLLVGLREHGLDAELVLRAATGDPGAMRKIADDVTAEPAQADSTADLARAAELASEALRILAQWLSQQRH